MSRSIALISLVLFTPGLIAQEAAKQAFAEADKEKAWSEHFDGVTLKEWEAAGAVQIKDGLLILGGPGTTTLRQKGSLGPKFKILIECRNDGPQMLEWRPETRSMLSRGSSGGSLNIKPGEWTELLIVGRTHAHGHVVITEQQRVVGELKGPESSGEFGVSGNPTIFLDVPPGGKLTIRRIRVDVATGRDSSAGLFIALGVLAFIILFVTGLGWFLRRRTRSLT